MLSAPLAARVLAFLDCPVAHPGIRQLNHLIHAYVRTVPWESAFRIARRQSAANAIECARWPEEFWTDAMSRGGGGTCFESNYAFFALLQTLGYAGYLTINNMGDSIGCHTAIVLDLGGRRYLADVGIPLYRALLLDPAHVTRAAAPFHTYIVHPCDEQCFQIERTAHPKRTIFTLIDRPVSDATYRQALVDDYGENGLFLDRVIVNKVIGDKAWRFSSGERPYRFEVFDRQGRQEIAVPESQVVEVVADRFGMAAEVLSAALDATSPT